MPRKPSAAIVRISRSFDRLELALALERATEPDSPERDLVKLLRSEDALTKRTRPDTLAAQLGIPYKRIVEAYRDSKRLEGIIAVAEQLPQVMQDVVEDAQARLKTCLNCAGEGSFTIDIEGQEPQTKKCIPCEGTGQIRIPGDAAARKQVLEMMELAGSARVPIVAPGSNIVITGGLEETLRAARGMRGGQNGADRRESGVVIDEQSAGADRTGA